MSCHAIVLLAGLFVPPADVEPVEALRPRTYSREEIHAALTQWRRSFRAIRLRSEGTVVRATGDRPPWELGSTQADDSTWADKRHRQLSVQRNADGTIRHDSFEGTDGATAFRAYRDKRAAGGGSDDEPAEVVLMVDDGSFQMPFCRPLAGLWWWADGCWLPELLEKEGRIRLDGCEQIEGVLCPRLKVVVYPVTPEQWVLVLDPRYGFLPREIREELGPGQSIRYATTEFRELGPGVFFPVAGVHTYGVVIPGAMWQGESEWSWKITHLTVNEPLPDDLFRPPIGPRTQVTDRTKPAAPPAAAAPPATTNEPPLGWLLAASLAGVALAILAAVAARRLR